MFDEFGRESSLVDILECPGRCANWETCVNEIYICEQYRPRMNSSYKLMFLIIVFFGIIFIISIFCYRYFNPEGPENQDDRFNRIVS